MATLSQIQLMKRIAFPLALVLSSFLCHVMAQKPSLDHIALYVTDLAKSSRFYSEVLQLDSLPEPFRDGKHAWFSLGGVLQLHLISGAENLPEPPKRNHICFSATSLNPFIDRLKKAGISWEDLQGVEKGITRRPDGVQQIYFRDPDGYWIEANDGAKK
jgi:lactoylglutathione lyase